jgi:hypothetical protein
MEFHVLPGPDLPPPPPPPLPPPTFATFAEIDSANNSAKLSEGEKNNKDFYKIFPTLLDTATYFLKRKEGRKQGGSKSGEVI